jgi:segregation and condensation protein A
LQSSLTKACVIKIEKFEGPFDLLYHLLEKNKIHIYDIPINDIADQYIDYLMKMKEMDLEIASEFLVVAATLLHIKSKMLLPKHTENDEEEVDPREELIIKLLEYKKFKEFSAKLKKREEEWSRYTYKFPETVEFEPDKELDIEFTGYGLRRIYLELIEISIDRINEKAQNINRITTHERVSLKEKIKEILSFLMKKTKMVFNDYFKFGEKSNTEIVTGFLGILELAKMRKATLFQKEMFKEIVVKIKNEE